MTSEQLRAIVAAIESLSDGITRGFMAHATLVSTAIRPENAKAYKALADHLGEYSHARVIGSADKLLSELARTAQPEPDLLDALAPEPLRGHLDWLKGFILETVRLEQTQPEPKPEVCRWRPAWAGTHHVGCQKWAEAKADSWIYCPYCGRKISLAPPTTELRPDVGQVFNDSPEAQP